MGLPERVAGRIRHIDRWLLRYAHWWLRERHRDAPQHVWVLVADHYEPLWGGADMATASSRVAKWRSAWPAIAAQHVDSDGKLPVYTFFYPQDEYHHELVEPLAEMTREGIGDVEVHIHHDGEGQERFIQKMQAFLAALRRDHGLLREHDGRIAFGFIHGNWAIDNSRPDGRWCGLNNEIRILRDLGCYADFTMPAADSPCQGGPINVIFRVEDDTLRPRSHELGVPLRRGAKAAGDLTFIPGPLALDFTSRGPLRPRVECGEIAGNRPVTAERVRLWLRLAPRVGMHAFLKLFAHGAQESNMERMLGGGLHALFEHLTAESVAVGAKLHFVSAWEMWKALETARRETE